MVVWVNFGVIVARRSLHFSRNYHLKGSTRHISMESNAGSMSRSVKSSSRGALVVLEDLDRCWKTTQSSRLHEITGVVQIISSYLSTKSQLDDRTIHLLLVPTIGRRGLLSLMETKLKSGTTVIVDHYSYYGVAFSSAKGLDLDWCKAPYILLLALDLVQYLDIPPEEKSDPNSIIVRISNIHDSYSCLCGKRVEKFCKVHNVEQH
ncbi:hypothetical protein UlMin_000408 [Ulmus minor]